MGKISYALSLLKQYELEEFKAYIKSVGEVFLCETEYDVKAKDVIYFYEDHEMFITSMNGPYIGGIVIHRVCFDDVDGVLVEYSVIGRMTANDDFAFSRYYCISTSPIDELYKSMQLGSLAILQQVCMKETGINSNTF